jgi:hypothetical protein
VHHQLEDTQGFHYPRDADAEFGWLLGQLRRLLSEQSDDPRHRLLASAIAMWEDESAVASGRFEAARNLLVLDQRDVWFMAAKSPVEALDDAATRLMVALGDAITAAGANFYFDTGEPFTPAHAAEEAYVELGDAIQYWKGQVLAEHRNRRYTPPPDPLDEVS